MKWVELFLTVVREGLTEPVSLEFLLPYTGQERAEIMVEVDKVALYHYKLKVLYEDKLRRRFGRANGQSPADVEDEATQALVNGVVGEISFGELVTGDAIDLAAEETDEEESSSEESFSSEFETGSEDESDGGEDKGSGSVNMAPSQSMKSPQSNKHHHQMYSNPHQRSTPHVLRPSPQPQPEVIRKKSFSFLRKSKSTNFSMANSSSSRYTEDAPPVPPVPRSKILQAPAATSKPLPLDPSVQDAMDEPPPPPPKDAPPVPLRLNVSSSKTKSSAKKKSAQTLSPPELEHIPKLLPVFAEIVSSRQSVSCLRHIITHSQIDETLATRQTTILQLI